MTLDLVSPWPRTCVTPGRLTKRSMIGAASSALIKHVDVLNGLLAAAKAAAHLHADDAGRVAQAVEQVHGQRQGLVEADAVADLGEERKPFEDFLLRLRAESLELGDLARCRTLS